MSVGTCERLAAVVGLSVSPSLPTLLVERCFRAAALGFLDPKWAREGVVGVLGPPVEGRTGGKPTSPTGPVTPSGPSRRPMSLSGRGEALGRAACPSGPAPEISREEAIAASACFSPETDEVLAACCAWSPNDGCDDIVLMRIHDNFMTKSLRCDNSTRLSLASSACCLASGTTILSISQVDVKGQELEKPE